MEIQQYNTNTAVIGQTESTKFPYEAIFSFQPTNESKHKIVETIQGYAKEYMNGYPVGNWRQYLIMDIGEHHWKVAFRFKTDELRRQFLVLNYSASMLETERIRLWSVNDESLPHDIPSSLWAKTSIPSSLSHSDAYQIGLSHGPLQTMLYHRDEAAQMSPVAFRWDNPEDARRVLRDQPRVTHHPQLLCPGGAWQPERAQVGAVKKGLSLYLKGAGLQVTDHWIGDRVGFWVPLAEHHLAVGKPVKASSSEVAGSWSIFPLTIPGSGEWFPVDFKEIVEINANTNLNLLNPSIFTIENTAAKDAYRHWIERLGSGMVEPPSKATDAPRLNQLRPRDQRMIGRLLTLEDVNANIGRDPGGPIHPPNAEFPAPDTFGIANNRPGTLPPSLFRAGPSLPNQASIHGGGASGGLAPPQAHPDRYHPMHTHALVQPALAPPAVQLQAHWPQNFVPVGAPPQQQQQPPLAWQPPLPQPIAAQQMALVPGQQNNVGYQHQFGEQAQPQAVEWNQPWRQTAQQPWMGPPQHQQAMHDKQHAALASQHQQPWQAPPLQAQMPEGQHSVDLQLQQPQMGQAPGPPGYQPPRVLPPPAVLVHQHPTQNQAPMGLPPQGPSSGSSGPASSRTAFGTSRGSPYSRQ